MTDKIKQLKRNVKSIDPMIRRDQMALDDLLAKKSVLQDKHQVINGRLKDAEMKIENHIKIIHSSSDEDRSLNVYVLENQKNYLSELEADRNEIMDDLTEHENQMESLTEDIMGYRSRLEQLATVVDRKQKLLQLEKQKLELSLQDEMWLSKIAQENADELN